MAVALLPAACSSVKDIRLSGGLARPTATIVGADGDNPVRTCVERVLVRAPRARGGSNAAVWEIEAGDGQCRMLTSLTYGEAPPGFIVRSGSEPLRAGVDYDWFAQGWSGGIPNVPWSGGAGFAWRDGEWREIVRAP